MIPAFIDQDEFIPKARVEKLYNKTLNGSSDLKIIETNALMQVQSESIALPANDGEKHYIIY